MQSSMDRSDYLPEVGPLPTSKGKPFFATKRGALVIGVILLIIIILAARFLIPHFGPSPKWIFQPAGYAISGSPVVANGMIYVTFERSVYDHVLFALDARSGSKQWSLQIEGYIAYSPCRC
jgi:outer membrane protein assembly factor BamB